MVLFPHQQTAASVEILLLSTASQLGLAHLKSSQGYSVGQVSLGHIALLSVSLWLLKVRRDTLERVGRAKRFLLWCPVNLLVGCISELNGSRPTIAASMS